jgi:chromate reductase, NAD(P)H dehydrogenase (quinone)
MQTASRRFGFLCAFGLPGAEHGAEDANTAAPRATDTSHRRAASYLSLPAELCLDSKGCAMPRAPKVVVFVGSLRKESFNRKTARATIALNAAPLEYEFAEIGNQPLYNQDLDTDNPPAEWAALRRQVKGSDAVLFFTPEYNRSIPGVLKNAVDVASRPYGKNSFDAKPGAVVSVSPGAIGGFGANHNLRQCLAYLNVLTMAQPEAYIGGAANLFDAQGKFANDSTRDFMADFVRAFAKWIETVRQSGAARVAS